MLVLMQLTPDILEQIVGYRTVRFGDYSKERRHAARLRLPIRTIIVPVLGGRLARPIPATLRELSTNGLSLMYSGKVREGDRFIARLPRQDRRAVWVECTAIRSRCTGAEHHLVGARFEQIHGTLRTA